jgi:hypothetical protein
LAVIELSLLIFWSENADVALEIANLLLLFDLLNYINDILLLLYLWSLNTHRDDVAFLELRDVRDGRVVVCELRDGLARAGDLHVGKEGSLI